MHTKPSEGKDIRIPGPDHPITISPAEGKVRVTVANAIVHGNHENPRKHVQVRCRCKPEEVSIALRDEGRGFDVNKIADPTACENIGSVHGRGIYLMKALMDEANDPQKNLLQ